MSTTKGHFIVIQANGEIKKVPAVYAPEKDLEDMSEAEKTQFDQRYEQLKSLVGGWLEFIRQDRLKQISVRANEEGKKLGLPYNAIASKMFGVKLLGDVLLTEAGQFDNGLTDEMIAMVMWHLRIVQEATINR